jgi:hypothetical protein
MRISDKRLNLQARVPESRGDPPPENPTAAQLARRGGGERDNAGFLTPHFATDAGPAQAWHAGASPQRRRRKTPDELLAGCEFLELYDRAHPGRLASRGSLT